MPVDDQDPAYRLVDPDTGDIVGTVYGTDSGDLAVQNESGTETLFTDDGIETPAVKTDGAVIDDTYHYASRYDGTDADARLDAALSAANNGDIIYLESDTYNESRTIDNSVVINGANMGQDGTVIESDWSLDALRTALCHVRIGGEGSISISGDNCHFSHSSVFGSQPITVSGGSAIISNIENGDITFESGSDGGIADTITRATVTDNGSNTIGDIA